MTVAAPFRVRAPGGVQETQAKACGYTVFFQIPLDRRSRPSGRDVGGIQTGNFVHNWTTRSAILGP